MTRHHSCRVSPFGHPRIHARLTAPRGISQPPTSFIGSQCQGIHHAPLHTYNTKHQNEIRKNCTSTHTKIHTHPKGRCRTLARVRCSQPLSTNQTPHPTTKVRQQQSDPTPPGEATPTTGGGTGLLSQSPTVCLAAPGHPEAGSRPDSSACRAPDPHPLQAEGHPTNRSDHRTPTRCGRA